MSYLSEPERWLPIPDLEGYYEASTHGRIRSVDRLIRNGHGTYPYRGKILKPSRLKDGRFVVSICIDGQETSCKVATLVARTFIGPRPPSQHVCHGPDGLTDNSPGNLYYGTPERNSQDRKRDGTDLSGEDSPLAQLTWVLVREIRERYRAGESQWDLAGSFDMSRSAISHIVSNRNWVDSAYQDPRKRNGNTKLNLAMAEEIRRRYAAGELQKDLAQEFGVSQTCISHAVRNETWARSSDQAAAGDSPP